MKTYKAITINGEPYLEPVIAEKQAGFRPIGFINRMTCLYIGSAIPDGTILDESEVEIKHEAYSGWTKSWHDVNMDKLNVYAINDIPTRQVATLKAKVPENKYPIGGFAPGNYYCKCLDCGEQFTGDKRASQCEPCAVKSTPSNSEEVEQPMKEPLVFPFSFVEWYSGMSAEKIERAWKRYQIDHGYTLTKK